MTGLSQAGFIESKTKGLVSRIIRESKLSEQIQLMLAKHHCDSEGKVKAVVAFVIIRK